MTHSVDQIYRFLDNLCYRKEEDGNVQRAFVFISRLGISTKVCSSHFRFFMSIIIRIIFVITRAKVQLGLSFHQEIALQQFRIT